MSARCEHWLGAEGRFCGAPDARRYVNSVVCPAHTPNALRGLPEPATPASVPTPVVQPATVRAAPADQRPLSLVPNPKDA